MTTDNNSGARHRGGKNRHKNNKQTQTPQEEPRYYNGNKYFQKKSPTQQIGATGLRQISGMIFEEYLQIFKNWSKEVQYYIEMRDDSTVGTLLDAIKLPILKAEVLVDPAPAETPGDIAAATWLTQAIHSMDRQTWRSHTSDNLDALDFGFAVGEITLEKRVDGRLWIKNIDPRGQETLWKWQFGDDNRGDMATEFIQRHPTTQEELRIPLSKAVHVTFRGRKGNPQGRSLLRSLYRPWNFKKTLENFEGIGIERDVGGMPVAEVQTDVVLSANDQTALKEALEGTRMDEAMYFITPAGVKIVPYGGGSKMYDVRAVIEAKQKEILGRMFAQFLKLGMDNVGTQALVRGSQDFFTLALGSIQDFILEAWNQQLVPYLFQFNHFAGMTGLPTFRWQPPGKIDIVALLTAYNTGVGAKVLTATDEDEEHIRGLLELPELPDDEKGMPRDVEKPAFPGAFTIRPAEIVN